MPSLLGKKHNTLLEVYLKTGKNRIFNKERTLFGQHKEGNCFPIKILVKAMEHFEGMMMQYVGLVYAVRDDYEYIITDLNGLINSMSENISKVMGIDHRWIHSPTGINIQLLAPELIPFYQKLPNAGTERYKESGGDELMFITPLGIEKMVKKGAGEESSKKNKGRLLRYNKTLNRKRVDSENIDVTSDILQDMEEYKRASRKKKAKCQVQDYVFVSGKSKKECFLYIIILFCLTFCK